MTTLPDGKIPASEIGQTQVLLQDRKMPLECSNFILHEETKSLMVNTNASS